MTTYKHSYYLADFIRPRNVKKIIKRVVLALKYYKFDAIAFSGYSGALLAAPLSYVMDVPMILVRKHGVDCHSSFQVEGYQAAKKYVIVDDCISSGETMWHIINSIKEFAPTAKCIGVLETANLPTYTDLKEEHNSLDTRFPLTNPKDYAESYGKKAAEEKAKQAKQGA